ncbi:MAG: hypothetical protein ACE5K9_08300 [Candidatus Methylomirabilales bacterium]
MSNSKNRSAFWLALVASFSIYLLPLVLPHSTLPWGALLVMEIFGEGRKAMWIAADLGFALALQCAAALLLYRFFRRPAWHRFLALVAAVPVLFATVQWTYLAIIPSHFLIEPDRRPELGQWAVACTIPQARLARLKSPVDLSLEHAAQAWVVHAEDLRLALLQMPGCRLDSMDLTYSNVSPRISFVVPGGGTLYNRREPQTPHRAAWYFSRPGVDPIHLQEPSHYSKLDGWPILSTDGRWIAWIQRHPTNNGHTPAPTLLVQALRSAEEREIRLSRFSPGTFQLLALDMVSEEVTLARNLREFMGIGLDGRVRWGPVKPKDVTAQPSTFRRTGQAWVAWDGYKERDAYVISWSTPHGAGTYRVPKGRRITSVAVDPEGEFIAVSVSGAYSIGNAQDAVSVFRVPNGSEVFRRYLPKHTRSQVAFLGPDFFAYSTRGEVRVLHLPD